jgi:hypothetical protein
MPSKRSGTTHGSAGIQAALKLVFAGIRVLKEFHPSRTFPIDGRLVGDIGEVVAERDFQVTLAPCGQKGYDALFRGKKVQVKATFGKSITCGETTDLYLGLKLYEDGSYDVVYNGPSDRIRKHYGHRKGFGKSLLSFPVGVMNRLSAGIDNRERVTRRRVSAKP